MSDVNHMESATLPERNPDPVIPGDQLQFSDDERAQIHQWIARYPSADGAIMRVLWLAQEKFGFLPPEVIRLSADAIGMPYARAYGVATFYTQYFKKKKGQYVLDVCTCFTCQMCGGYDILHHIEDRLGVNSGETTPDDLFTIQEAECLGACGSAPVLQVTNGPYVMNLTPEKVDALIDALREGRLPHLESVTLPQDEKDLGGNRRTDTDTIIAYRTPPIAQQTR